MNPERKTRKRQGGYDYECVFTVEGVDTEEPTTPGGRKEPFDGMSWRGISMALRLSWGNMILL